MLLKPKLILNNDKKLIIFSRVKRLDSCGDCLYNSFRDKTKDCRYIDDIGYKDLSLHTFCSIYSFPLYIPGKLKKYSKLYNYVVKEKIIIKKT